MMKAAAAGEHETALKIARAILARDYMNIEAHFAATLSCAATKDEACEAHHKYVAGGLIASILASGDGQTPATAYVVVKTPEEYALLRVLRMRRLSQALMHDNGHSYDVLTVQDQQTGQESRLYFNIDASLAAMARVFGLKIK